VIRQELQGADSSKAYLFCTLKSKKIPEEIGFPRLLISGKANVFESLETYSIAKYHNNDLVTKYGAFNYPSLLSENGGFLVIAIRLIMGILVTMQ